MQTLAEHKQCLRSKRVLLVGSGPTDVDYATLPAKYQDVVLVNHALTLAPLFSGSDQRVYFFTWHPEVFSAWPEFTQVNVRPCLHSGICRRLAGDRGIGIRFKNYAWQQPAVFYDAIHHAPEIRDREQIAVTNQLVSMANSMLLALHFLYYAEASQIDAVGVGRYRGVFVDRHDQRLDRLQLEEQRPPHAAAYWEQFEAVRAALQLPITVLT